MVPSVQSLHNYVVHRVEQPHYRIMIIEQNFIKLNFSNNTKAQSMAVYTKITDQELKYFVTLYNIGEVQSCKGIAEGVENTNYLLQTTRGKYIVTLYEKRVSIGELPFFLGLMEHLALQNFFSSSNY